jgi:hypothetical protein
VKGGPISAPEVKTFGPGPQLAAATLERAAAEAPGWDVRELERLWRAWIEKLGKQPDKPDVAFLGFVRKHINSKRG